MSYTLWALLLTNTNMVFFVYMYVCGGYMYAEAIKHWMLLLRGHSPDSFGTGSLMAWNSPRRLGQMSSKP